MTLKPVLLQFALILIALSSSFGQVVSNQGKEFWTAFPSHIPDAPDGNPSLANMSIFVTSDKSSSGKISVGNFSANFSVVANTVTEIKIPRSIAYIDTSESGIPLSNKGVHILVDPGQPKVVVYSHIFAGRRSAASLLLPVESLGKSYFSMNYMQDETNDGKNFIIVIASNNNTSVRLKRGNTDLVPGGITLSKAGDVYEYLSKEDLSGVSITSSTPECSNFAVFTGSSGTRINPSDCTTAATIDPLFQQAYPVQSWGLNYAFVPFSMKSLSEPNPVRTRGQFARILAKDDGTTVQIDGLVVATLNAGQFFTTPAPLNKPAFITASKPVCVAQYALSQACSGNTNSFGDPDMVLLNPIEYSLKNITVYSSSSEDIKEQYVNVVIKNEGINTFKINGTVSPSPFSPMPTLPGYSYLQLNLNSYNTNNFHITSSEAFNAIAYGFGPVESYAYSAGTNLFASYTINAIKQATNQIIDSACVQDDYFFKLTLPFKPTAITWQLDNIEAPIVQTNPTGNSGSKNGIFFYEFTFPKTPAYDNFGKHDIKIHADYAASECALAGQLEINNTFTVITPPMADFDITTEDCDNTYKFKIKNATGVNGELCSWDFGDGSIIWGVPLNSTPSHTYLLAGDYTVQLILSNSCSTSLKKTIHINQSEQPAFDISNRTCVEKPVTFTDKSNFTNFKPVLWEWQFGDNQTIQATSNLPVYHAFTLPGEYPVKLILKNALGCILEVTNTVKIYTTPLPDFNIPQTCSGGQASVINLTTEEPSIQYLWDFGDINSTMVNANTSTLRQPTHIYSTAGIYTVTLTVQSANGCKQTVAKNVQITQMNITPEFDVQGNSCDGDVVTFKNLSVTNSQTIKTIEWYFDYDGRPNDKETFNNPINGDIYTHLYPPLPNNLKQLTYKVKLRIYVEGGCFNEVTKNILITKAPSLYFDTLPQVCTTMPAFRLTQATETTGVQGTGTYSGAGVTANGFFDPEIAGAGEHVIKYTFTTSSGCIKVITKFITVLKPLKVNLPQAINLEKNQSVLLKPTIQGDNLTYLWSPSTGLNNSKISNPTASPQNNTTYTLTVSNGICNVSATVIINVLPPIEAPNTFTPNGDGINDIWIIRNIEKHPDAVVDVFNRYGANVFHSKSYNIPWDGRFNSSYVPTGAYYYIISFSGSKKQITGSLTVIR
ncbi:PKD domain-containing protein [Mucilaginibacter auburnensis]|uniref:Gliding motility-associated-like protein n=1 Tax=Mucilaginibacter auburnensis TaxID=1457233 RepID=A0A2H9VNV7_9SPHI|nr:PKD domain-containing protein [Mucilaginibacter auburnensis]PJJ79990.1 gliding motility-associated-like protein [Mucilaginibacter auburnensis]